ncbi:hypothetical protein PDE_04851 [Penicillium oxalicum 114-2]|uniref:Uncharacterized protein n=1 Tax=Penicillium oxalicum (strain 114-2 / CGMCC 5302) TaxID=933388 RepID=S7ZMK6_PENO1|nr:hypothetical protein PDE_04851 [Penicillium oxalicum 114-2]
MAALLLRETAQMA